MSPRKKATKSRALKKTGVIPPPEPVSLAITPPPPGPSVAITTDDPPPPFPFPRVTITRGDDVAFEIELALGDITETPSRVILLGQFQGMDPTAASVNLDEAMNGALFKLINLRRSSHAAGELDIIPTGRHPVMAEMIAFLGLGHWNLFNHDVLAAAAHSGLRSLLASHFEEFSTVLMGGRLPNHTQIDVGFSLRYMLRGFIQALRDDDERDRFRRVVIVEKDEGRLREIHQVLRVLVQEEEFKGVRTTLCASRLPARTRVEGEKQRKAFLRQETNLLMLSMRPEETGKESFLLEAVLHTRSGGAAIIKRDNNFAASELNKVYEAAGVTTEKGVNSIPQLERVSRLVTALLPDGVLAPIKELKSSRIELIHDAESSRLPWETLALPGGGYPALVDGFSRRFVSERAAVIWPPKLAERLRILMIINPTGDLDGARDEGEAIRAGLAANEKTVITYLEDRQATKAALVKLLAEQAFDILHYSGHSAFNLRDSRQSGLVLHGDEFFTGTDVLGLAQFPPVVIFNSCEAARIRHRNPTAPVRAVARASKGLSREITGEISNGSAAHRAISVAEAFLIAGVQHYIGTFWPVADKAAALFGEILYRHLADGKPMGFSVTEARKALANQKLPDWANYIHYGNPDAEIFPKSP
jgi:CHAT domain